MSTYTQASRQIQVFTALAADVFLLQGFSGEEGISRPFQYDLYLHSEDPSISFDAVVGKKAAIRMILPDNSERYINGIVSGFSQAGATHREGGVTGDIFAHYHATVVPWTWMLTRTTDCRIFQNMSVPDIITKVFQDHGFSDFKKQLHGSYQPREYCVQYRETDLNFVSRLMEEEGIFYFFEHQPDKHILIMADSPGDFMTPPGGATVSYESIIGESPSQENVTEWLQSQEVRPGRYTINDFNFEKPLLDLTSSVDGEDERKFEIYDPPGRYLTKDEGERLVGIRMEEEDTPQLVISGSSNSKRFVAGYKFNLTGHYRRDFNRSYVLTTVRHSATQGTNYGSSRGGGAGWTEYSNEFQCIPDGTAFRPSRITPIPVVHGSQTAIVVGPAGEEIYVDKYGRVKVQFHWDREGKYNEKSSCWIRVSQNWAGKRWGAMFIPRIGQEVIVDFIEGDPDRPIITGRVYNGGSMPPYDLPAEKTKSSIKTYSSKGGGGFNELRFEDKKGSEQIFIHAEKNKDIRIKNELKEWVGSTSHEIVTSDRLTKVSGERHIQVGGDKNEKVGGTLSLNVTAAEQKKVGSNYALDAGTEVHIKSGTNLVIETGTNLTVKVGANFININPQGIYISGKNVYINSGGTAGTGLGSHPNTPKDPAEADDAVAGQKAELPPPKQPPKPAVFSPGALMMKQAAQDGMPFCEM